MSTVLVRPDGTIYSVYDDKLDLRGLGQATIRRASYVEANAEAQWEVDLSPIGGPKFGPFEKRHVALAVESDWLDRWLRAGGQPERLFE